MLWHGAGTSRLGFLFMGWALREPGQVDFASLNKSMAGPTCIELDYASGPVCELPAVEAFGLAELWTPPLALAKYKNINVAVNANQQYIWK